MPKAKPTQVIVHRLELQQTERDTLEAALAGKFVTNAVGAAGSVIGGFANVLKPFEGAITALAVLWIGDRALDEILGAAKDLGEKQKKDNEESYEGWGAKVIAYVSALLTATYESGGWPSVCALAVELRQDQIKMWVGEKKHPLIFPNWFGWVVINFIEAICDESNPTSAINLKTSTPTEIWATWYSVEEFGKNAYYYETNGTAWGGVKKTLFG